MNEPCCGYVFASTMLNMSVCIHYYVHIMCTKYVPCKITFSYSKECRYYIYPYLQANIVFDYMVYTLYTVYYKYKSPDALWSMCATDVGLCALDNSLYVVALQIYERNYIVRRMMNCCCLSIVSVKSSTSTKQ